jgi:hypothetical protein
MRKVIIISCACIALGACVPVDRGFGETVRLNNLRQTVNPEGTVASAAGPLEGGNGPKASSAVKRYETGTVTPPVQESSRSTGGGGGSTR